MSIHVPVFVLCALDSISSMKQQLGQELDN